MKYTYPRMITTNTGRNYILTVDLNLFIDSESGIIRCDGELTSNEDVQICRDYLVTESVLSIREAIIKTAQELLSSDKFYI
jgi:hypothetical protein